ncbi:MAG: zinc ribbon domain-containing protein [Desulfatitalea sp.]|nr:zinc ribbon domain-containing protein [Desulfatitalea sp.]NNK00735.1 zinc ribbon domain-containing protein [Desulfatitalea sp.]
MPIYEFYCEPCNTIFNFFSRSINTSKRPKCPHCKNDTLSRRMSTFAVTGRAAEADDAEALPFDESKMERAMQMLSGEAEHMNEDDPRQAADLMRRLTDMTGLELGDGMQEALRRMENGEDPDQIEADLSDVLENEDPFQAGAKKGKGGHRRVAPRRDETLYDL